MTRSGRWFPLLGVLAALVLVVGPGARALVAPSGNIVMTL